MHLIIEAKRGFTLPDYEQLKKYAERFKSDITIQGGFEVQLVVLAESDHTNTWLTGRVRELIGDAIDGIPVSAISWNQVTKCAADAHMTSTHAQKRLLTELVNYLERVSTMQDKQSNRVYVVSLGRDTFPGDGKRGITNFIEVVEEYQKYFHPVGRSKSKDRSGINWPKQPPNYMAFRYDAELRSIHHVERWDKFTNFGLLQNDKGEQLFPGQPDQELDS